jgi:hypothetical protein
MLRWIMLGTLLVAFVPLGGPVGDAPPAQSGRFVQSELADWLGGTLDSVYVEGGDLRLQPGQLAGVYESQPLQAPFAFNAAVVQWHAAVTTGQTLTLELRSSVDGQSWAEWQAVTPRGATADPISQLVVVQPTTSWLQYRARFQATGESPSLADVTLTYLNSAAGPALPDIIRRVAPFGPPVETPAPATIAGLDWGAITPAGDIERQQPRRIAISVAPAPANDPQSAATVRALQWIAVNLEHRALLPYHFLIDGAGTIYQGPGSVTMRLPDSGDGTVEIALLSNLETEGLSDAGRASLARLLGWLSDAYRVGPAAVEAVAPAPNRLQELMPELRASMDRAIVRSRLFFAAGDTATGPERLALLNRGPDEARATITGISALGPERHDLVIGPGKRVDLPLNATFPVSGPLSVEVLADRRIEAERTQNAGREILGGAALSDLSRVHYFADASGVEGEVSTIELLNPHEREVRGNVVLYPDTSAPISHTYTLAARSRQTVSLDQILKGQRFSVRIVSSETVAAEQVSVATSGAAFFAPGVTDLSRRWLFAEGGTMSGYTTTLALFNPWPDQVAVTLQVVSEDGTSLRRQYAVPGQKRTVLTLNDIAPDLPVAMDLTADRPLAAERTIRFDNGRGATAGPGATRPAPRWVFVEGATAGPADEYLLVLNPNAQAVGFDVAYTLADGRVERRGHVVGAAARLTISVKNEAPDQPVVSAIVTADRPVVAERTIYVTGSEGRGGETSLGIPGE